MVTSRSERRQQPPTHPNEALPAAAQTHSNESAARPLPLGNRSEFFAPRRIT